MAGEFKHKTVGDSLAQLEYEDVTAHVVDAQETGDLVVAVSPTQLERLPKAVGFLKGSVSDLPAYTVLGADDVPNFDASKIITGTIDAARLPDGGGGGNLEVSDIPNLPTSKITSGVFSTSRIPNLSASKIVSGTFSTSRIPNLSAGQITSGVFDPARIPSTSGGDLEVDDIPNLPANKITSGTFGVGRIPGLPVAKITSGMFPPERIPYLSADFITSGVFDPARVFTVSNSAPQNSQGSNGDLWIEY